MTTSKRVHDRSKMKSAHDLEIVTEKWKMASKVVFLMEILKKETEMIIPLTEDLLEEKQRILEENQDNAAEYVTGFLMISVDKLLLLDKIAHFRVKDEGNGDDKWVPCSYLRIAFTSFSFEVPSQLQQHARDKGGPKAGSLEFDKRAVAVMHELFSFIIEKRLVTDHLIHFRRELVMPKSYRGKKKKIESFSNTSDMEDNGLLESDDSENDSISLQLDKRGRFRMHMENDGRTRTVFDAVVKIQRNIQEKDKEVRQNFGNWILQWMKSSDQIQVHPLAMPSPSASSSMSWTKQQATKISSQLKTHGSIHTLRNRLSDRLQSTRLKSLWNNKPFHGIAMMMRLPTPAAVKMTQYRNLFINGPEAVRRLNYTRGGFEGRVIRRDIGQWMLQN
ncbi:hypothetical protein FEM48_Zijuj11G0146200 [Ziziphus jujuba var. spinosa]|uniref:PORR domain-containing protein n=1 Tax=Ziziphus jujuba var. spinosa TaxID=714518 RepID=A0A978UJI4_ZIZJJ|nr:hypothetical protein FEM48_Zijuj11G0146200 [Ziziphus jujuba var. spinosa]